MRQQSQMMTRLYIESKIKTEVIGNPVTVTVRVVHLHGLQSLVVILSGRNGSRATRTIIHIERHTVTTGKLIVSHQLEIMRFVILRRIPVSTIDRAGYARVILAQESTRIRITGPSVQLAGRLLYLEFNAIGISFRINHVRFQMMIHDQPGRTAIIQIIVQFLIVPFHRQLQYLAGCIIICPCCQLPAILGFNIRITQFPGIRRRHNGSIRYLMNILPHGVEACLYGEVIIESIAGRQSELRPLIGLNHFSATH